MAVPFIGLAEPLRSDPPPASIYCACGIRFEHRTRDGVLALHAEHQADMRDPEDHLPCPF